MSKQIDWSKPLSDEERSWAEQFTGLHAGMLEANAAQFPPKAEATLDGEPEEEIPPYTEWTVKELIDESKRRNSEDGKSLPVAGTKSVLVAALEDDDKSAE